MNKRNIFSYPLVAATVSLLALYACQSSSGNGEVKKETTAEVPPIEAISLKKDKLSTSLTLPGELISYQQVDLYARETSFVKQLYADVGTSVQAGQLLVSLEAPEISSRLSGAESRWKSQEAVYLASKAQYDRLLETSKTPGTISPNDLDQARARMQADLAQLEATKAAYREAGNSRDYLSIRAPFSGVITARNVNPGAYVGPTGKGSEFPLFTLQEQKRLRLVVTVPEAYTGFLQQDLPVTFRVKALPNDLFQANIKRLAHALDVRLRSERIEMDVQNDKLRLLPGMIAEVYIPLPARDSAFVVPKSAVVNVPEKVFVIRVTNGRAEWVPVTTGRTVNGKTEVYGTLTPGDPIIKVATDEIRDGSEVKVKVVE